MSHEASSVTAIYRLIEPAVRLVGDGPLPQPTPDGYDDICPTV